MADIREHTAVATIGNKIIGDVFAGHATVNGESGISALKSVRCTSDAASVDYRGTDTI
jgi:hypothetical protein